MLPRDVLWRVAIIAIGVAHWESGLEISSRAVLMWCALVLSLLVAAQATYSGRLTPSYFRELTPRFDLPLWSRAALGLGLATTIGMINTQIDTPLVGLYLTKAETGQFFAVQKTASLLIIVLWATIIVAAPNFSRLYHSRQVHELQRISRSFAISVGSLSLAIYFVFFVFGRFLLGLFGPSFTDMTLELRIMSTGYLIDALCGPAGVLLLLSGHERLHLKILLVFLALKTSLMILLLPRFGLLGAAIGASLSQAIVPVVLCLYIRRTIGIDPSVMGALNYLRRA
jgi:O-antigen/teichoic acid export membrane protein